MREFMVSTFTGHQTAREGGKSVQVDKWSAGCQVIAANADFKLFMEICRKARDV